VSKAPQSLFDALKMLDRRARRGRSPRERAKVMNTILGAYEVALADAHMSGRVYHEGGEQRMPGDEHRHMMEHANRAFAAAAKREWENAASCEVKARAALAVLTRSASRAEPSHEERTEV
jgi:hypothetical protein